MRYLRVFSTGAGFALALRAASISFLTPSTSSIRRIASFQVFFCAGFASCCPGQATCEPAKSKRHRSMRKKRQSTAIILSFHAGLPRETAGKCTIRLLGSLAAFENSTLHTWSSLFRFEIEIGLSHLGDYGINFNLRVQKICNEGFNIVLAYEIAK